METAPPRVARALLAVSIPRELRSTVLRDLDEVFDKKVRETGAAAAARWYRREAASCAWRFAADRVTFGGRRSLGVSTIDLKLAGRMIVKSPGLTLVGGLAIATAIAVTVLAFELVNDVIRPVLPLPNSDRVVTLIWLNPRTSNVEGRLSRELFRWQRADAVASVGGYVSQDRALSTGDGAGEVKLAKQVIGNFEKEGDLTQYEDDYQKELQKVIDAKIAGDEISAPAEEAPPKVVNLMEALRQSLERVSTNKKRPATARAAVAKHTPKKRARG